MTIASDFFGGFTLCCHKRYLESFAMTLHTFLPGPSESSDPSFRELNARMGEFEQPRLPEVTEVTEVTEFTTETRRHGGRTEKT